MQLYFKDNFFNSGRTEILSDNQVVLGEVDLRSSFGSALDIYDRSGSLLYIGKFPLFSGKWAIANAGEENIGTVRSRLAFFAKIRHAYDSKETKTNGKCLKKLDLFQLFFIVNLQNIFFINIVELC